MATAQEIINQARKYIDVPFHHAGRNELGLDCVGLLIRIANDLNIFNYDNVDYSPHVVPERLIKEVEQFGYKKGEPWQFEIADIVVFKIGKWPHHVGIISVVEKELFFIHSNQSLGKVVEQRLDSMWYESIHSIYKLKVLTWRH